MEQKAMTNTMVGILALLAMLNACVAREVLQAVIPSRLTTQRGVSVRVYPNRRLSNRRLIILDVNSLVFKANHPYNYTQSGPDVSTIELCAQRCARTSGCNGFVSCARRTGCGRGCVSYVGANPALTTPQGGTNSYISNQLPLLGFGFWTYPLFYLNGCQTDAGSFTVTNDKWCWGLCSLQTIPNITEPEFTENQPGSLDNEFTSGVLIKPPGCPQGLPYSVCAQCNLLRDARSRSSCLQCASFFKVNNSIQEAVTLQDQIYDFCPRCFTRFKDAPAQTKCVNCLRNNAVSQDVEQCVGP